MSGEGANTVIIHSEVKHITELDALTLCFEWSKLKKENKELYRINQEANNGWRGLILKLIGIYLPDGERIFTRGYNAKGESVYSEK